MVDLRSCPFCGGNEIIIRPVYYAGIVNTKTSWLSELPDLRAAIGPRCPNCQRIVYRCLWSYCPKCGARLEWGKPGGPQ